MTPGLRDGVEEGIEVEGDVRQQKSRPEHKKIIFQFFLTSTWCPGGRRHTEEVPGRYKLCCSGGQWAPAIGWVGSTGDGDTDVGW